MRTTRSANLRRINLLIGAVLTVAGVAGGFLLTFWFLVILLPLTCIAASWMMAATAQRARDVHIVATPILTGLFLLWLLYFLQNGAAEPTWHGIFLIWILLMGQVAVYLAANRQQQDPADM
jgi:CDP-diglyceride synthetase